MNAQLNLAQNLDIKTLVSMLKMNSLDSFMNMGGPLNGRDIIFTTNDSVRFPIGGWDKNMSNQNEIPVKKIVPVHESTMVSGIDSTCLKIAETADGSIYAIKCGLVFCLSLDIVLHFRIGPLLVYLTDDSLRSSELDSRLLKVVSYDSEMARRMIRINMERLIQYELSKILHNSVILVDGALKASIFENRQYNLSKITENCLLNRNILIGLAKSTKFKILDKVSIGLRSFKDPGLIDVGFIIKSLVRNSLGYNTMVKFAKNTLIMRADIVASSISDATFSLGKIMGNDPLPSGYPESLSMAHHISSFSSSEISGIKVHLLKKYNVVELPAQNPRQELLGSL
jgi:hypothetical protein